MGPKAGSGGSAAGGCERVASGDFAGREGCVGSGEREARGEAARRPYPQLVTLEPEEGEDLIYGTAMPAIGEWREARRALEGARRRLDKLDARKRVVELEVRLVEDRELTLPPAVYPWDRADRRDEVWRRKQSLAGG